MTHHLAQMNVAYSRRHWIPRNWPVRIRAGTHQRPGGAIARLCLATAGAGDATALRPLGDHALINMSVWQDVASIRRYVYESEHIDSCAGAANGSSGPTLRNWCCGGCRQGTEPSVAEGIDRLKLLQTQGPTPAAFTFGALFPAP